MDGDCYFAHLYRDRFVLCSHNQAGTETAVMSWEGDVGWEVDEHCFVGKEQTPCIYYVPVPVENVGKTAGTCCIGELVKDSMKI